MNLGQTVFAQLMDFVPMHEWFCPLDLAHFDHLIWPTPVGL